MNKLDGQIWIESNAPYKLKYHRAGKDFAVETSEEYVIPQDAEIKAGDLVKIGDDSQLVKAEFPNDLRNVIGMLVSETGAISRSGYATIPVDYVEEGCSTGNHLYWIPTASGKKYSYSIADDSDIIYHNLPFIGTVVAVTNSEVTVHLNMKAFDTTIEWYCQKSVSSNTTEIPVDHKLVNALSTKNSIEIDNKVAIACYTYDSKNGTTVFNVNTADNKNHVYNLSGSVIYG